MTDQATELARSDNGPVDCGCSFARGMHPTVHSDLIGWLNGQLGYDGVAGLISDLTEDIGLGRDPGDVAWFDFPRFVGEHNWPDPAGTSQLARAIDELIRAAMRNPSP